MRMRDFMLFRKRVRCSKQEMKTGSAAAFASAHLRLVVWCAIGPNLMPTSSHAFAPPRQLFPSGASGSFVLRAGAATPTWW